MRPKFATGVRMFVESAHSEVGYVFQFADGTQEAISLSAESMPYLRKMLQEAEQSLAQGRSGTIQ